MKMLIFVILILVALGFYLETRKDTDAVPAPETEAVANQSPEEEPEKPGP